MTLTLCATTSCSSRAMRARSCGHGQLRLLLLLALEPVRLVAQLDGEPLRARDDAADEPWAEREERDEEESPPSSCRHSDVEPHQHQHRDEPEERAAALAERGHP